MNNILNKLGKKIILPLSFLGLSYISYAQENKKNRTQRLQDLISLGDSVHTLQDSIYFLMKSDKEKKQAKKLDSLLGIYNPLIEKFKSGVENIIREIMQGEEYQEYLKNKNKESAKVEYCL